MTESDDDSVVYIRTALGMADLPVENVINGLLEEKFKNITLVGRTENGELYMASSYGRNADAVYDLELMKMTILKDGRL